MPEPVNPNANSPKTVEAPDSKPKKPVIHIQKGDLKTTTTEASLKFMTDKGWEKVKGAVS